MRELEDINFYLHEAYGLIYNDRPAMARMALTKAICVLKPFSRDYKDAKEIFIRAHIVRSNIKREWLRKNTKEWALIETNGMCNETNLWLRHVA